ncbi:E3 ubiquitin-protein ligase TRIM56 isoform X2 [Lingula anatina]|nr:E3 ubiquitin-protein ligase TRIM56 isoform X2 [Lingula anatina]XP_013402624.1 E3 ubiquitin-protein ligase TRIM56 isoform X2 [Lingula anatina]|eukprot:XP_013402623.1 E3 ubiquitin-protein ligase TRIM56 isoform X2 [Lingula anatina]
MANSAGKLAQEINEEFLTCKICLETYKEPKSLNCLHTFCESCIENHAMSESSYKKYSEYRDFTCPLCRKRTHLPTGGVKALPDNFLVASLTEVITRQKPTKFPFCDICKLVAKKHREASSKCLDCAKLLCKQCVEVHRETKVTKNHSIFDVEIEKDVECKDHPEEVVRFYCEPCETCVCVLCTFNEHKDHDISNFSDAVMTYKDSIQKLLNGCKDKLDKHEQQLDTLAKADKSLKQAEQKIRDVSIQFISEIRTREKQLIEELHNLYGPALMEFIHRKADMQITLEGLKSTCNLTELILKGKDIELLLLKNQVQEKLRNLSDLDLKPLPPTVGKQVQFVPGALDMGYIQDMDRPLSMSKIRARRAFSSSSSTEYRDMQEQPEVRTTDTQTDSSITSASNCEKTTMTDKPNTNDKNCATVPPTVITVGLQTDVPSPENTSANVVDVTVNLIPDTEESSLVQESREERERRRRQARRMREENGEQEDEEDSRVTRRQRRRRMNRASNEGDSFESNRKSREFTSPPPPFRRVERQSQVYHGDSLEDNSSP